MLLIRGIQGEQYARRIETGFVSFRDLLTTVLYPQATGYIFSDYYEKYICNAIEETIRLPLNYDSFPDRIAKKLLLIFNRFLPYYYVTYFHVLNEDSVSWLNSFQDDASFIYLKPRIDKVSNNLIATNILGRKMKYIQDIGSLSQESFLQNTLGLIQIIDSDIKNISEKKLIVAEVYAETMVRIFKTIFTRETSDGYPQTENEFRIVYKVPTVFDDSTFEMVPTGERCFQVMVDKNLYKGVTEINHKNGEIKNCDMKLTPTNVMHQPTSLMTAIGFNREFYLVSDFLDVNIKPFASRYGYIGDKEACKIFIERNI